MPEGPEVKIMARRLNKYKNWHLIRLKVLTSQARIEQGGITGVINKVSSRGKLTYWEITNKGGKFYIICGLGLAGFWTTKDTDWSKVRFTLKCHNIKQYIYLADARGFSFLKILSAEEFKAKISKMPPDILSKRFTLSIFKENLNKKSIYDHNIAYALLSQKVAAGAGTYITSDSLYLSNIKPGRKVSKLSAADIRRLYKNIIKVATESYTANKKINLNIDSDIRWINSYKFKIYGKKHIGNKKVKKYEVEGRYIHYI